LISWKRGFLEIIGEILEILNESPLKKSHISFKSKLDSRAVTRYLEIMIQNGLIKKSDDDSTYFELTKTGLQYLKSYQQILGIFKTDFKEG